MNKRSGTSKDAADIPGGAMMVDVPKKKSPHRLAGTISYIRELRQCSRWAPRGALQRGAHNDQRDPEE